MPFVLNMLVDKEDGVVNLFMIFQAHLCVLGHVLRTIINSLIVLWP